MNEVKISLLVTPVVTLTGMQYLYSLSDSAYGEFIVFKDKKPYYYLYVFDMFYNEVRSSIEKIEDFQGYLTGIFSSLKLPYQIKQNIFGVRLNSKSYLGEFDVEKLPVSFFQRNV